MARRVTDAGAGAGVATADAAEKQVLIGMDGEAETMWHHLLLQRLDGARWITCDPHMEVVVEDLTGERVVPLARNAAFPLQGRPFLALPVLTDAMLANVRAQAMTLAEVHGAPPVPVPAGAPTAVWLYSDTGHASFGQEVLPAKLGDPGAAVVRGSIGMIWRDPQDGTPASWLPAERILRSDQAAWLVEKRSGAGRDPRLSASPPALSVQEIPLLRTVLSNCSKARDPNRMIYQGPSSTDEVLGAILRSGLEPQGFMSQFLQTSGAAPKAATTVELGHLMHGLWMAVCVDRLDPYENTFVEHLSRRILQIQKAIRRSPRGPDFDGLNEYMRHSSDQHGEIAAPAFDAFVAEKQKTQATIMKQQRLQREEDDHANKRRQGPKGAGKKDGDG